MISVWISSRVNYSDKRHVNDRLRWSRRTRIREVCGAGRWVVFVCLDSAAVNDDSHRRTHMIWLMTDVVLSLLSLLAHSTLSGTQGCSCFILVTTDTVQCTLLTQQHLRLLFCIISCTNAQPEVHVYTPNTHFVQKHMLASLLSAFHGHEHWQWQTSGNIRRIKACVWGRKKLL